MLKYKFKLPARRTILNIALVAAMLFAAYYLGQYTFSRQLSKAEINLLQLAPGGQISKNSFNEKLFWEVWQTVAETYVDKDKVADDKLFHGALRGLVAATGDPYSFYMTPAENKEFAVDMSGKFEGIGTEIGLKDNIITVVSPLEGMPAEKAGLKAGDQIVKINDEPTTGFGVIQAVEKIRGPKGTPVKLSISRGGVAKLLEFNITRDVIVIKSVKTELTKDNIYVIRVSNFNDDTDDLFSQAAADIVKTQPRGIILDLRNNPGGYLESAVAMSSYWVKDQLVVSERYGDGSATPHKSFGEPLLAGFKTVVLVNRGSASAAEIVAGALQDYGLATIVGEQTYGKGSVQVLKDLSDGGAVKITAAKWFTPKEQSIDQQGIKPDVLINESVTKDNDPVIKRAVEIIK